MKWDPILLFSGIILITSIFLPWFGVFGLVPGLVDVNSTDTQYLYRILVFLAGMITLANGLRAFSRFWTFWAAWTSSWVAAVNLIFMMKAPETTAHVNWLSQFFTRHTQPSLGFYALVGGAILGLIGTFYSHSFDTTGKPRWIIPKLTVLVLIFLLIAIYPNYQVYSLVHQAKLAENQNDLESAKNLYQQALSTPTLVEFEQIRCSALKNYGLYCYQIGEDDEALIFLASAVECQPTDFELLKTLGVIHFEMDNVTTAQTFLERADKISPDDLEVLRILVQIDLYQENWIPARNRLQRMANQAPNDPATHALLGKLYLKQGHYDQAAVALQQALRLDPDRMEAHVDLAYTYMYQKKWVQAMDHFQKAALLGWDRSGVPDKLRSFWDEKIAPLWH